MELTNIFDSKVFNNEYKLEWGPLVAQESRGGGGFVVAMFFEARVKEIVGKFSRLGKAVDAFSDLKIDPTVTDVFSDVVFLNEIMVNAS